MILKRKFLYVMYQSLRKHRNFPMIWYLVRPIGNYIFITICLNITDFSRPSTPIAEVLQNRFLDNWLDTMEKKQAALKKERTDAAVMKFIQLYLYIRTFY